MSSRLKKVSTLIFTVAHQTNVKAEKREKKLPKIFVQFRKTFYT